MSLEHVKADAPPDEIVEVLGEDGGVIVEGLLDPDLLARFNAELDPLLGLGSSDPMKGVGRLMAVFETAFGA